MRRSYSPAAAKPLIAQFRAYRVVARHGGPDGLVPAPRPVPGEKCVRCGTCCATLNPGMTDQDRFDLWRESGTLTVRFVREVAREDSRRSWYTGWFHDGTRLRLCPLLLLCRDTDTHLCAVYHLGEGHRPEACEGFAPNPPHCEVSQRPLVP